MVFGVQLECRNESFRSSAGDSGQGRPQHSGEPPDFIHRGPPKASLDVRCDRSEHIPSGSPPKKPDIVDTNAAASRIERTAAQPPAPSKAALAPVPAPC